jgi:leucyl-tRNA synthetase
VHRFLARLWRLGRELSGGEPIEASGTPSGADLELLRKAHWAIEKVSGDMTTRFAFNTAIAAVMELVNEIYRSRETASAGSLSSATATAASLIQPFAPHVASEVYELLTGRRVWEEPWPDADPGLLERDTAEVVCQVNGKVRDRIQVSPSASKEELEALAREAPNIVAHLAGREVVKVIVVPGRLVNFVVR